ncbi:MAG: HU family DNA-binding protein [Bacteroidaceae bacterium]|nr:HU family DNA-binding protein [Bacteroidaceae bacterium]
MGNRASLSELTEALASRCAAGKKQTEQFVHLFFDVVADNLLKDKIVKVRGLGTFKLVNVDERESVNISTGERIVIPAHSKFTFTPDPVIRDEINKPFADFEATPLNDDINLDEINAIGDEPDNIDTPEQGAEMPDEMKGIEAPAPVLSGIHSVGGRAVEAEAEEQKTVAIGGAPETGDEGRGTAVSLSSSDIEEASDTDVSETPEEADDEDNSDVEEETEGRTADIVETEPAAKPSASSDLSQPSDSSEFPKATDPSDTAAPAEHLEPGELPTDSEVKPTATADRTNHVGEATEVDDAVLVKRASVVEHADIVHNATIMSERKSRWWVMPLLLMCALLLFSLGYYLGGGDRLHIKSLASDLIVKAKQKSSKADKKAAITKEDSIKAEEAKQRADREAAEKAEREAKEREARELEEAIARYPQVKDGKFLIIGSIGTDTMRVGRTLLNISRKYYGTTDYVEYICIMNGINNPDIVPKNAVLNLPKLRHKE